MVEKINHSSTSGEKLKGDRIMSTIESLMNGKNNQKIIENLNMYYDAGRGARVSIFHENIEDSEKTMVMTEPVYSKMKTLVEKTSETKKYAFWFWAGYKMETSYLMGWQAISILMKRQKMLFTIKTQNIKQVTQQQILMLFYQCIGKQSMVTSIG